MNQPPNKNKKDDHPQKALDGENQEPENYGPDWHEGSQAHPKKQSGSMSSHSEPGT